MRILEGLALSVLAVFAPIQGIIITTLILILSDLITGILAALKKKQTITSAGLRRTVTKLAIYLSAVCLGYLVEFYMISGLLPVSKIVAALIGLTEAKSIFENLDVLNGNPIFKSLIEKLGSINDSVKKKDDK